MKNKKILIILLAILIISGVGLFLIFKDDGENLNLLEKQWIEKNKNNLIDMSIVSDIPVLSYNGEGVTLDFLNSLNSEFGLSFNKISYKTNEEVKTEYAFKLTDEVSENDLLIYTDNYVLLTKDKTYSSLNDLNSLNIGVLNSDLDKVNSYLYNINATYTPLEEVNSLIEKFNNDESINAIVLLKTSNLKTIIENDYKIAYHINDYKKYLVLTLGSEERLNSILTKYYNKWINNSYDKSYNKYLSKNYFSFKDISDSNTVQFRSKRYNYGFVSNAPFDFILDGKLMGINNELLSNFSKLTNAEISYKEYDSIEDMKEAFNSNKIDLYYELSSSFEYNIDTYNTMPLYNNNLIVLKHSSNDLIIDSLKSLKDVIVLKNSMLSNYLKNAKVSFVEYENMDKLINSVNNNSVVVMDLINYNYYKNLLEDYVIAYQMNIDDYSFVIRDINDNKLFSEMLDFYISFIDTDKYVNIGLRNSILIDKTPIILKYVALVLGSVVGLLLIALAIIKIKPKKNKVNLTKEDKLRYIDSLTSLKNRLYLNDSIGKWDQNEVYPQSIVILDLNNIAYINDNYGHAEGDFVINQAANVLILNQIENSEIIRTNGNEFLIYLVGYDEKQVVSYIRKLNKELKEVKHGFGVAIGYSMINDGIKTIDDAINEATIDMRNNKEETREWFSWKKLKIL